MKKPFVWIIEIRTYMDGEHHWSPLISAGVFRTRKHTREKCKELRTRDHCREEFGVFAVKYRVVKYVQQKWKPLARCGYYPPNEFA
jgi:hypothetical protein